MYQIVKGWPSEGALDEVLTPVAGSDIAPGTVVALDENSQVDVATLAVDDARLAYFVIDNDPLNGGLVGLKAGMIIECDSDHYDAAAYTPNQEVTANAGKFAPVGTTEKPVGKVISYDAVTGKLRLVWTALG